MVVIVGGGLAGLACAIHLERAGVDWMLYEGSLRPGGRVATDVTADGFRLDRGFQVLLDSYRTARELLDFKALKPCYFQSGALLANDRGWERILNPLVHPNWIGMAPFTESFTTSEKMKLGCFLVSQLLHLSEASSNKELGFTSMEELRRWGLDRGALEKFLRPFFAGVFLDNELAADASILHDKLRRFLLGRALLPAGGMGEIPMQLAASLPSERQFYGSEVTSLRLADDRISALQLASGKLVPCDSLVLATDEFTTRRLLSLPDGRNWSSVSTFYFTGEKPLYEGALLVLPEGASLRVRHFTDLTNTAPDYAPPGRRLLSATVLGNPDDEVLGQVQSEIVSLLPEFESWTFLKRVTVNRALPSQIPGFSPQKLPSHPLRNLWLAGDQCSAVSIDSALASGWKAAAELLQ